MKRWLARVRHDLVKHGLFSARDLRELDRPPTAGDLQAAARGLLRLRDDEGREVTAAALWGALRAEVEDAGAHAPALDAFERAVTDAEAAARELAAGTPDWQPALDRLLHLDDAFTALARDLES